MMPQSLDERPSMSDKADKFGNIQRTVRSRVECEERAFHIVNKLIDDYVDETLLAECGRVISREHYSDIVEERAISRLCGYPVCPNSLGKTPNKKYHVSTKTNKVYEISERKNFCSNQCFRASRHFSSQIPDSPLWMRDKEQLATITLLECDTIKGILGDEVIGSDPRQTLKDDLENLKELDKKTSTSKKNSAAPNARLTATKSADCGNINTHTQEELDTSAPQTQENTAGKNTLPVDDNVDTAANTSMRDDASPHSTSVDYLRLTNTGNKEQESVNACDECNLPFLSQKFDQLTTKNTPLQEQTAKESSVLSMSKEIPQTLKEHSTANTKTETHGRDNFPSKMDHLKALLSKQKNVLLKMVDVQTVEQKQFDKNVFPRNVQSIITDDTHSLHEKQEENHAVDKHPNSAASNKVSISSPIGVSLQAQSTNNSVKIRSKQSPHSAQVRTSGEKSPLLHVSDILKTWVTSETVLYLSGGKDSEMESSLRFSHPQVQKGYGALCHRLAAQEKEIEALLDGSLDGEVGTEKASRPSKPVPDYKALREETEAFTLNVMEFITGKKQRPRKDGDTGAAEDTGIRLPTVDAYDQHQIRIRIVMDRVDKSLPDVLVPLCLSVQDVSSPIREFVHTCRLEKDSIVLRPGEWTLAVLLILRVLATRYPRIESAFTSDLATRHFSAVLSKLGHDFSDLQTFAQNILRAPDSPR